MTCVLKVKGASPDTLGYLRGDRARRYVSYFQSWVRPQEIILDLPFGFQ